MAGKTMWGICALSGEDLERQAKPLVASLRLTAEYMKMGWGGAWLSYGNSPSDVDVLNDENSVKRAGKN